MELPKPMEIKVSVKEPLDPERLDTGKVEDLAIALRCYAGALQSIVEAYMQEKHTRATALEYADYIDWQLAKLKEDIETLEEYLGEFRELEGGESHD